MHIPDNNLRLAILEGLVRNNVIPLPPEELRDTDEYEPSPAVEQYWGDQWNAINASAVTRVIWNEAPDVQQSIWPYFDGEEDYFDITSLEGIAHFAQITSVEIAFFAKIADLSPLLDLPNLTSLWLQDAVIDTPENRSVVSALTGRGVRVQINGQSGWPPAKNPQTTPATPTSHVQRSAPAAPPPERFPSVEQHYRCQQTAANAWWQHMETWIRDWSALLGIELATLGEPSVTQEEAGDGHTRYTHQVIASETVNAELHLKQGFWLDGAPSVTEARLHITAKPHPISTQSIKLTAYAQDTRDHLDYLLLNTQNVSPDVRIAIESTLQQTCQATQINR